MTLFVQTGQKLANITIYLLLKGKEVERKERLCYLYFVAFLENLRETIAGAGTRFFCGKVYVPGYTLKDEDVRASEFTY